MIVLGWVKASNCPMLCIQLGVHLRKSFLEPVTLLIVSQIHILDRNLAPQITYNALLDYSEESFAIVTVIRESSCCSHKNVSHLGSLARAKDLSSMVRKMQQRRRLACLRFLFQCSRH